MMQHSNASFDATVTGHPSTRILITGVNGFVGRALCAELLEHGYALSGAVRRSEITLNPEVVPAVVGDINDQTDWNAALTGIDIVVHLAARVHVMNETAVSPLEAFRSVNVHGTERLARAAVVRGVKRLVYVSSIKVNGEETIPGQPYTELDVPSPEDPYGTSKWEAEQVLHHISRETGLEVVIVRPPLVYGPDVKGNFAQMLKVVAKGIPLPFASVQNKRSMIYLGNFVEALRLCAIHPAAAGNTYLVSDGEDVSTPDLLRQIGAAMGHPARLFPCPPALLRFAGVMAGQSAQIQRLLGSLQVDSGKMRCQLNWQPTYTLDQGLQLTAERFINQLN